MNENVSLKPIAARNLRLIAVSYALIGGAAFYGVYHLFVRTAAGQRVDEIAFAGSELGRTSLWRFAAPILDVVSLGFVILVIIISATVAILRQRWLLITQVAIVMGGTNIATQVLKRVLPRPDLDVTGTVGPAWGVNTLPSGHTTVAMTTAIALLLIAPPKIRPLLAIIGTGYGVATGISTLIGGWHRASDVIAAIFLTLVFTAIALLLDRPRSRVPTGDHVAAIVLTAFSLIAAIIAVWALVTVWQTQGVDPVYDSISNRAMLSRGELLRAYAGGALGCFSAACAVVAAVLLLLQRRGD